MTYKHYGTKEAVRTLVLDSCPGGTLHRGVCHQVVRGLWPGSFCEQPGQQRSRPGLLGRQRGSRHVRSLVLGVPVRSGWHAARGFIWFWTILEMGNGIGHSALALSRGGYFPGVVTAPLLLVFAVWLAVLQVRQVARHGFNDTTTHVTLPLQCAVKGTEPQREINPPGNWIAPPGSNRSDGGVNKAAGASGAEGRVRRLGESAGCNASER
jgi:hypothetical protein